MKKRAAGGQLLPLIPEAENNDHLAAMLPTVRQVKPSLFLFPGQRGGGGA